MEKSVSSETGLREIAVFDFDHTLVQHDSFWSFMAAVAGWPRTLLAFAEAFLRLSIHSLRNRHDAIPDDPRTFIKAFLMEKLLGGKTLIQLKPAIELIKSKQQWVESVRAKLMDHHVKGRHIVIASGALDIYLSQLVIGLPHDALICTKAETIDGIITGRMAEGNCVRQRKAEMLRDYMAANGPFGESWGYGNYPHDVPMLDLLKHRIIV